MRFLRLELRRFGPFTDQVLDLAAGSFGLHIVFGPNEAGKSSALRAVKQLFYGIPHHSADIFLHPHQALRIGAVLESASGERLECVRRKGRLNTLRAADDDRVVPDEQLAALLGGIDKETFARQFGIGYEELKQGGQEIVSGGGEAGQVLFAAGAGLSRLRLTQEEILQEAEQLFKPRGSTQRINQAITKLKEVRRQIKEKQLSAGEWRSHDEELRKAEARGEALEKELRKKRAEVARLERVREALPKIVGGDAVLEALAPLGDVPLLVEDFATRYREAREAFTDSQAVEKERTGRLISLEKEIADLDVPRPLLEQAPAIRRLSEALAVHRKARGDRRGLAGKLEQAEAEVRRLLETLDRRPGQDEKREPGVTELSRLVRRVEKHGGIEGRLAVAVKALGQARKRAGVDLERLSLWSGRLEDLEKLGPPLAETIDRFDRDLRTADDALSRLRDRLEDLETKLAELDRGVEQLERQQDVPTEVDLAEARRVRDRGWRLILQAWHGEGRVDEEVDPFIERFAPGGDLAAAFDASVQAADDVADRLRREADRVAQKAHLLSERESSRARLKETEEGIEIAEKSRTELIREWEAIWQPLAIRPWPPREMQSWLKKCNELARSVREIREQTEEIDSLTRAVGDLKKELGEGLECAGQPAGPEGESLAERLERAHDVIDTIGELEKKRGEAASLRGRIEGIDKDADGFAVEAARLVDLVAHDLVDRSAEQAAAELGDRLSEAEKIESRHNALVRQRDGVAKAREKAHASVERAEAELEQLCREAGCGSADELPETLRRSEERRRLEGKRDGLEERLTELAAGKRLEDFITECRGVDADEAGALILELNGAIDECERELGKVQQAIGRERSELERMDGSGKAAELREHAESLLARIRNDAGHYARLRLASAVLRLAVERFRERNQDPVLRRAGGLFSELTRGSFAGLRADFDDKGEAVIAGLRPSDRLLGVEAMSNGTADQLYLALRLAMLEQHLEQHEPVPLLVDDILVMFDDDRALAALSILARLSAKTQIIFFTHHERLVDLAREHLVDDCVFVHRLGAELGGAGRRDSAEVSQEAARP